MNVLILGSGGREHALAWRLSQDTSSSKIFIWPGNDGMVGGKISLVKTPFSSDEMEKFMTTQNIGLVVPGSEQFLYDGVADTCAAMNIPCFGPGSEAAVLEKSKIFSKKLMAEANVPSSKFLDLSLAFERDINEACLSLRLFKKPVIKISGPSLGKGVFVCDNSDEASEVLRKLKENPEKGMEDGLLVEESVSGKEVSMFFACSGTEFSYLGSAQDHKRVFDGDKGPNTGGMGAISPVPWVTKEFIQDISERFLMPTLKTMQAKGKPFKGVLFLGLMVDGNDINLLEYNVRFGDPETQVLLPLIEGDFTEFLVKFSKNEQVGQLKLKNKTAVHVVKAAAGYPGTFGTAVEKGMPVTTAKTEWENGKLFFAGVKADQTGTIVTNGGRVLGVTAWGDEVSKVRMNCYRLLDEVHFAGEHFRTDIGRNL